MSDAIVGRREELETLGAFVAAREWPRTLLLSGDAGIGKTTLWLAAVTSAGARGFTVLTARPAEAETKLSFSTPADVLRPAAGEIGPLPDPQRRALRAALPVEEPVGVPDPPTV